MNLIRWFRKDKTDTKTPTEVPHTSEVHSPGRLDLPRQAVTGTAGLHSLNPATPIYVEIQKSGTSFTGRIYQGDRDKCLLISPLTLHENAKPIPGRDWTLARLAEAVIRLKREDLAAFDERVQLEVGRHLYREIFDQLPAALQDTLRYASVLRIHILTEDEWIAGLPWHLMACRGLFCCTIGWTISIARRHDPKTVELPPSPRLLIVAPQPKGVAPTQARDHLEDLEDLLSSYDPLFSDDNHLAVAETWEKFLSLADSFQPELIYYYGHGIGGGEKTRLIFATGPDRRRIDKPVADMALCLRSMKRPPLLAYINCCQGDAGGFLGVGMQLGDIVPAVITNRTVAEIDVARKQALSLLKTILFQAVPPNQAVTNLYAGMDLERLTTADFRWITPVCHAHYGRWIAKPPTPPDRLTRDPHWHLKIDRVNQYNAVVAQTRLMMREQKPKSLAFVWYGREGQGIETFHKRILVELREELTNAHVHQVRPRWPEHLGEGDQADYHSAFSDVLTEVFSVNTIEDIPARLRADSYGRATLLYVRHEPVHSDKLINPETLKEYVRWWDTEFALLLEKKQFALLTTSFLVKNPPAFAQYIEEENIDDIDLRHTVFWLLDEMEKVGRKDLLRFLRTHNIDLPEERRDDVLQNILNRTGGRYEQTVEELKKLRKEAWRVTGSANGEDKPGGRIKFKY